MGYYTTKSKCVKGVYKWINGKGLFKSSIIKKRKTLIEVTKIED